MKEMKTLTINGVRYDVKDDGALRFDQAENLTNAQKNQARQNMGAASAKDQKNIESLFEIQYSPNLLNLETVETGYLGNSGLVDSSATNYITTDFISCTPGDVIRHQFDYLGNRYDNEVKPGYNSMTVVCAYDADKNFITGSLVEGAVVYTVPEGAGYVRITYKKSGWNTGDYSNSAILISADPTVIPFTEYGSYQDGTLKKDALPEIEPRDTTFFGAGVNRYDPSASHDGYYVDKEKGKEYANANYTATDYIPVHGLAYIYTSSINHVAASHGAFYDENKNWIAILNPNQATTKFAVPEGAYYVRMTVFLSAKDKAMISASPVTGYVPYGLVIPEHYLDSAVVRREELSEYEKTSKKRVLTASANTLTDGQYLTLANHIDVKKNKRLLFFGQISNFSALMIGHGESAYAGSYVIIDDTNVSVYNSRETVSLKKQAAHGLRITDFISVLLEVSTKAKITVITATGSFTLEDGVWEGCNGTIFGKSMGSVFTGCQMAWTTADISEDIWVFGDSYLGLTGARYPRYLLEYGFDNWLACGYPGAQADSQISCFTNLLELGKPRLAVWGLGMNNPDNGAVNASWLENIQAFIALCEDNHIEPVLATIPNAYSGTAVLRDNSHKNAWVRDSGYRYIDFETAVEKADGSGWYEGMLSADGVHPDTLGSIALAHRFIRDVPEICIAK